LQVLGTNVYLGRSGYDYSATNQGPNYLETWTLSDAGKFSLLGTTSLTSPAYYLRVLADLLIAQENDSSLAFFDVSDPADPHLLRESKPPTCNWLDLSHADGDQARGVWAPMSDFGAIHIPVTE
jgi:hypothetical protein